MRIITVIKTSEMLNRKGKLRESSVDRGTLQVDVVAVSNSVVVRGWGCASGLRIYN